MPKGIWNNKSRTAGLKKCLFETCYTLVGRHGAKGLCPGHYVQLKKRGDFSLLTAIIPRIIEDPAPKDFKTCRDCREILPLLDFSVSKSTNDGFYSYCKKCDAFQKKFKTYKLTREQFLQLLSDQDHCCSICRSVLSFLTAKIDHNHDCCPGEKTCGKCVRGLLCSSCNTGLGCFKDNEDNLYKAIFYLKEYS